MSFSLLAHPNGTRTLVDAENGQAMHSRIGPETEAKLVYADRAKIDEHLVDATSKAVLYDVGMGTAANVIAALERIAGSSSTRGTLVVFSFETKPEGLKAALAQGEEFPFLEKWRIPLEELLDQGRTCFSCGDVRIEWRLLVGDFYGTLSDPTIPPPDFVFFDFYSPKMVPELWAREKFEILRRKIEDRPARLFTYSAASPVRLNLLLAGFFVGNGVSTGVKSETTIAATRLELLERPLDRGWLRKLETSASLRDVAGKDEAIAHPQWDQQRN